MARVNIYLPDELAEAAKATGLNVSRLTQEAIRRKVRTRTLDRWLERTATLPDPGMGPETVAQEMSAAKDELELGR